MEREYFRRRDPRNAWDLDERQDRSDIVKTYPSLSYGTECHLDIIAFDKLDGSNVRAEWSKKRGWHKFGTRKRLVDESDTLFGRIPKLVTDGIGPGVEAALLKGGYDRAMCFFELHGTSSFAGQHDPQDETLHLSLIDVAPFNQGIIEPERFIKLFGHLDTAKVLYRGPCTAEFIESVRDGSLPGMTFEGVVCKVANDKRTKMPIMFKQKSRVWLDKLHAFCGTNSELFNILK